jgi:hypothetical protein
MNRLASAFLVVLLCPVAYAQSQQSEQISGRYFTADTLLSQLQSRATEKSAQLYLMGAYDLTQDSGQSCAVRGTTTPIQLIQVFSNYLRAHSELMHSNRTAAGVAAQAFADYWPCKAAAASTALPSPWPNKMGEYTATSSELIPPFPRTLSGYRSEEGKDFWGKAYPISGTIRIFSGDDWKGLPKFPNTMNGCASGVFMIRWRSSDTGVRVDSTARNSSTSGGIDSTMATGAFGYMYATNCDQPLFKFARTLNKNESGLVDIFYELKFWQAAP